MHRRLVAVLGDINTFIPHLQQEAQRQSLDSAPNVIWLTDGGQGFWRVYQHCFANCAIGILDFFHAAGHLWRSATALFENPHSAQARAWFKQWRHQLRHGHHHTVLASLTYLINANLLQGKNLRTLLQVQAYFQRRHAHIHYQRFENRIFLLVVVWLRALANGLSYSALRGLGCAGARTDLIISWFSDSLGPMNALTIYFLALEMPNKSTPPSPRYAHPKRF